MDKKSYNNAYNQGVEASFKQVEMFRITVKPVETGDPIPLTTNQINFNLLVDQFQAKIKEALK